MKRTPDRPHHPAAEFNRALRNPDDAEAFRDLLAAAENGCMRAQFLVGLSYHLGRGVAVDYDQAALWYGRAAASGDTNAMTNLGVLNLPGQGGRSDEIEAYTWIQSAVGMGHGWLRPTLEILEHRINRPGDPTDAARVLSAVAPAMPNLGPCTRPECDLSRCNAC